MAKITCPSCGYHMFNVDGGRPAAPQVEEPQPSAPQELRGGAPGPASQAQRRSVEGLPSMQC